MVAGIKVDRQNQCSIKSAKIGRSMSAKTAGRIALLI
jgi:hypothetical protein